MKPKTLLEQKAIEYFNEDEEFHSMPCFEAGWRACREELANRLYSLMVWPKDSSRSEIIRAFGDQPAPDNVLFFEKKEIELSQKTKEESIKILEQRLRSGAQPATESAPNPASPTLDERFEAVATFAEELFNHFGWDTIESASPRTLFMKNAIELMRGKK